MQKICIKCRKKKNEGDFVKPQKHKFLSQLCKDCRYDIKTLLSKMNRIKALKAYGNGRCACCKESIIEFLTLDHINGNKRFGKSNGYGEYRFLRKYRFPHKDKFRVLCMNCNWSIGVKGYCPHKFNKFRLDDFLMKNIN